MQGADAVLQLAEYVSWLLLATLTKRRSASLQALKEGARPRASLPVA